ARAHRESSVRFPFPSHPQNYCRPNPRAQSSAVALYSRDMLRCSAVFVAAALTAMAGSAIAQTPVPRPTAVVDNGEFMDLFLKTTYGELQQAMPKAPVDRRGWATIYQRAIQVAEMQNLLFFRDRPE